MRVAILGLVTAIVLAGGRSSRFGSDKLAARYGDSTLLARAVSGVAPVSTEVIVVVAPGDDRQYAQLMYDHHLGGIHMAFFAADRVSEQAVKVLAQSMVKSQNSDIDELRTILDRLG